MLSRSCLILSAFLAIVGVSNAQGATVSLGGGWQASWDASLDPFVDINVDSISSDTIFIQKSAEFIQGPDAQGLFPTIPIVFQQTAPSSITRIRILDEIITNSTGADWTDFHFDLLDGGDAAFDNSPGFFFTTVPLTNQSFSPDATSFWVDGFGLGPGGSDAVVADGTVWFPGNGASDGNLDILVNSKQQAPFTVFTLKETPTPEPSSLVLLAFGGASLLLRRR